MELERARAVLRPRAPWEGVDLGFALARAWFLPLWGLWWLTALPLALVTVPWLRDRPDLWLILIWWCKPLFEALPLLWLAAALFGTAPSLTGGAGALGRSLRGLIRPGQPARLLPYLLWRRLAPSRSLDLPTSLLEGLRGRDLRERRRVLHGGGGTGAWLTLICVHLEMILGLGALLTLFFLVPEGLPRIDLQDALLAPGSWAYWTACLLSLLAMSILAPFYLAGGFALYLTRRTQLEAWDLERVFRRARAKSETAPAFPIGPPSLAARTQTRPPTGHRAGRGPRLILGLCLTLAALVAATPEPAQAQDIPDAAQARALIAEVLAGPDFGSRRQVEGWIYVGDRTTPEDSEDLKAPTWLRDLAKAIAAAATPIQWALALAAAALLALLLHRVLRDLPTIPWTRRRQRAPAPIQTLGAVEPQPPLPQDIPAAVRARLAAGATRAALALLYQAAIQRLVDLGVSLPSGATEGDCLNAATRARPPAEMDYLRHLTRLWLALAYAHREIAAAEVEDLLRHWGDFWPGMASIPGAPGAAAGRATHGARPGGDPLRGG